MAIATANGGIRWPIQPAGRRRQPTENQSAGVEQDVARHGASSSRVRKRENGTGGDGRAAAPAVRPPAGECYSSPASLKALAAPGWRGATAGSATVLGVVSFFSRRCALLKSSRLASRPLTIL